MRGARNLALGSLVGLVVAVVLLALKGIRMTRLDYLLVAGVVLLLLGVAWAGTHWGATRGEP